MPSLELAMCLCITSILARAAMTPSIVVKGMTAAILQPPVVAQSACWGVLLCRRCHWTRGEGSEEAGKPARTAASSTIKKPPMREVMTELGDASRLPSTRCALVGHKRSDSVEERVC